MWDSYLKLDKVSDVEIFIKSTFCSDKPIVKFYLFLCSRANRKNLLLQSRSIYSDHIKYVMVLKI
jgi:hypothetical protein